MSGRGQKVERRGQAEMEGEGVMVLEEVVRGKNGLHLMC